MKKRALILACAVFMLLALVVGQTAGQANRVEISWWVLGGGGASASGQAGPVSLNASLGQPITGETSSDETSITGGFWSDPEIVVPLEKHPIYLPLVCHK